MRRIFRAFTSAAAAGALVLSGTALAHAQPVDFSDSATEITQSAVQTTPAQELRLVLLSQAVSDGLPVDADAVNTAQDLADRAAAGLYVWPADSIIPELEHERAFAEIFRLPLSELDALIAEDWWFADYGMEAFGSGVAVDAGHVYIAHYAISLPSVA